MNDNKSLVDKFSTIKNPWNYFIGKGKLLFPTPNNVLSFYRNNNSSASLWTCTSSHYRYVCIFNLFDPIEIIIDGRIINMEPNEGILLLPFQLHKFVLPKKDSNTSCIFITFTMEKNAYFEMLRYNKFKIDDELLNLINLFYDSYNDDRYDNLPHIVGIILNNISMKKNIIPKDLSKKAMQYKLLQNIITEIQNDLHITIIELSQKLNFSENYIRRYFKNRVGITLGEYIIDLKIDMAKQFLYKDDFSISEIAERCGYQSESSFSRSFKNKTGIPPQAFKKLIEQNPLEYNLGNVTV
jgi:AraC-like DNA-binding protein